MRGLPGASVRTPKEGKVRCFTIGSRLVNSNLTSPLQCQVNKLPQIAPTAKKFALPASADKIWAAAQEMLRYMLNSDIFNLWFAPIQATGLEGDQITLEVSNDFCEVWLK